MDHASMSKSYYRMLRNREVTGKRLPKTDVGTQKDINSEDDDDKKKEKRQPRGQLLLNAQTYYNTNNPRIREVATGMTVFNPRMTFMDDPTEYMEQLNLGAPLSMAKGGKVKKTGLVKLHKGEVVIPTAQVAKVDRAVKKAGLKPLH